MKSEFNIEGKKEREKNKFLRRESVKCAFISEKRLYFVRQLFCWRVFFLFFWSLYFQKSTNMCVYLYISKKQCEAFHVLNEMSSIYKAAHKPVQTNIVSIYCNLKVAFSKEISENIKKLKTVKKCCHSFCFHVYLLV